MFGGGKISLGLLGKVGIGFFRVFKGIFVTIDVNFANLGTGEVVVVVIFSVSDILAGAGEGFLSTELANSLVMSDVTNFANFGMGLSAGKILGAGDTLMGGIEDGNDNGSSEYEWNIGCCCCCTGP